MKLAAENQIVVYQPNETVRLDVRLENETVWLLQSQIAELFKCSLENVRLHLKNIYASEELDKSATSKESLEVRLEGNRKVSRRFTYYNLDAIISIGYRVNSIIGVKFRQWATRIIKERMLAGVVQSAQFAVIDRHLLVHDREIADLKQKVDFFVQTPPPPLQSIFYQNQFWDAKPLLIKFIRRAKKELIVIDAYPGVATLDMLAKRGRGVKIELADLRSQNVTAKTDVKEAA